MEFLINFVIMIAQSAWTFIKAGANGLIEAPILAAVIIGAIAITWIKRKLKK